MEEQFYTILTKLGKSRLIEANVSGKKLDLVKFQIGDGSGSYYNPTESQAELKHKVWEGLISRITVDENNPNWVVIETALPNDIGGFMIREAGVFDVEGNLIAIGKYPETYKPVADEGSSKELVIKMILELSNTSSVTLKIDKSLLLATKKDIEILENKIKNVESPVKSVNNKTGDVELKIEDIKDENGQTLKSSLDDLKTKDKSLDENINELNTNKVNNTDYSKLNLYVGTTSGTSTAYTKTVSNDQKSYVDGQQITIVPHISNGSAPTLNINNLGLLPIVNFDGSPLKEKFLKPNIPVTLVRVGNSFFVNSGGGSYRKGDHIPVIDLDENQNGAIIGFSASLSGGGTYAKVFGINNFAYSWNEKGYVDRTALYYDTQENLMYLDVSPLKVEKSYRFGSPYVTVSTVYDLRVQNIENRNDVKWKLSQVKDVNGRKGRFCQDRIAWNIYTGSGSHICNIDPNNGNVRWKTPVPDGDDYSGYQPVTSDETNAYGANFPDGTIRKYNGSSGTVMWEQTLENPVEITALAFDRAHDLLIVATEKDMFVYGGTTGKYYYKLDGSTNTYGWLDVDIDGNILAFHQGYSSVWLFIYTEGNQPTPYRRAYFWNSNSKYGSACFSDYYGKLIMSADRELRIATYGIVLKN